MIKILKFVIAFYIKYVFKKVAVDGELENEMIKLNINF